MRTHIQQLEAEAIHIMREVAAEFKKPVMLYSIGKDSGVLLHLAQKGLLARAVDWIIQPLGRDARIFRVLIEQKHQPLQGMGRIGSGFKLQLGVRKLRPIPHR